MKSYFETYAEFLVQYLNFGRPLSIVCDASNGPAGLVIVALAEAIKKSGAVKFAPTFTIINDTIDPDFSAHGPNPLAPGASEMIAKKIIEIGADFGVIFDADADRAVIVDNKGELMPAIITSLLLFKGGQPPYVADELLFQAIQHGNPLPTGELIASKVGVRFIKEKMKEVGATRGAESSGHYYFKEFFGLDSGVSTMIAVANTLSRVAAASSTSSPFADFKKSLNPHEMLADAVIFAPATSTKDEQREILNKIFAKINALFPERISESHLDGTTYDFGDSWLNIRTSNTEPLLRFTAGAPQAETAQALIDKARKAVVS